MPNPTGHIDSIKETQFSSPWQSGATRTIRVPLALADATLEYARQLDRGAEPHDTRATTNGQVDNLIESVAIETPDTGIILAENVLLRQKLEAVQAENEKLKAVQPAAATELPEAAELLNQLKAKRKKSTASLADIEAILEILEE